MMMTKTSLSVATAALSLAFCQPSAVAAGRPVSPVGGDATGVNGGPNKKDAMSFVFNRYTMTMYASKIEEGFW